MVAIDRAECVTVDETMQVFELAATASSRFKMANPDQKRELINLMCSNCFWRDGSLELELHEIFDLMLNTLKSEPIAAAPASEKGLVFAKSENWWRQGGSNP